jgi:hypothetical protein
MDTLSAFCVRSTGMSNTFTYKGDKYFFEHSRREHADGAITGTLNKFVGENRCKTVGSLRIDGDGKITRGLAFLRKLPAYYILETIDGATFPYAWDKEEKPTPELLLERAKVCYNSYKLGGLNAHVSKIKGYIPTPTKMQAFDFESGEMVAEWKMPSFFVWD